MVCRHVSNNYRSDTIVLYKSYVITITDILDDNRSKTQSVNSIESNTVVCNNNTCLGHIETFELAYYVTRRWF